MSDTTETETDTNTDTTDEPSKAELHERVQQLESTVEKLMPSRRDALKLGAAGIAGAAGLSATTQPADASTGSAGTIGSSSDRPDAFLDEANVNQLTGVSTEGIILESTDTIDTHVINKNTTSKSMVTLYNGSARTVLGGAIMANDADWRYTFSDGNTVDLHGGAGYSVVRKRGVDPGGDQFTVVFLPPAKDVTKINVSGHLFGSSSLGAYVYLL